MPAVNTAKVAQISAAIEQGTYTVNSQQAVDRLMQMDKELSVCRMPRIRTPRTNPSKPLENPFGGH